MSAFARTTCSAYYPFFCDKTTPEAVEYKLREAFEKYDEEYEE